LGFRIARFAVYPALDSLPCKSERNNVKNIFVGNLSFDTTEDTVRSLFKSYGAVDRVNLITDRDTGRARGFGFVEMPNDAEGAQAISGLNGREVGGRALNVNEARPKGERDGGFSSRGNQRQNRW
jgi:RNA recognition motif-containing protein